MAKEKLLKHERGSITVFAIVITFSLIFILGGIFATSSVNRKNQLRTLLKIKELYYTDGEGENEKVARVGETEYSTLQNAIDSVSADNKETTVYLLKDVKEHITIAKNKNIVLDMDSHLLAYDGEISTITLEGTLKVNNGTIISAIYNAIFNKSGATLIVTGGEIKSTYGNAISNYGAVKISGTANFSNTGTNSDGTKNYPCVWNDSAASITISGGTIRSEKANGLYNLSGGEATISGGEIKSVSNNAISNYGTMEVSGTAKLSNDGTGNYPCLVNQSGGKATINGGTISSEKSYGLWNKSGGTVNITGGEITSTSSNAIVNVGTVEISGTAKISNTGTKSDGTGNYPCVYNQSKGKVTISGGIISSEKANGLYNLSGGTATITGGIITSVSSNAIYNYGTVEISGTAEISNNGAKEGDTNTYPCIYNQSGATVTISGGTISSENSVGLFNKSTTNSTTGEVTKGTVVITGGEITSTNSNVINNYGIIEIGGKAKIHSESKATFYNREGAKATITGGEITSTSSNAIVNLGTVEISGTAEISNNGAKEGTTTTYPCLNNQSGATATISGGTISSEASYGFSNKSGATATITGGTFTSTSSYAIYNEGTITSAITGATINGKTYGI